MRKNNMYRLASTGLILLTLGVTTACSSAKNTLGLGKTTPDEFMVTKHAPLSMPPDYRLRPPTPGTPRPQEQATSEAARAALLGQGMQAGTASTGEALLLQQTGSTSATPNIRALVDQEATETSDKNQSVANKLIGWGGNEPSATVVDAGEEAERLKQNAEQNKPVTEGETPSIEE